MIFRFTGQIIFEAKDIDDALFQLSEHFRKEYEAEMVGTKAENIHYPGTDFTICPVELKTEMNLKERWQYKLGKFLLRNYG